MVTIGGTARFLLYPHLSFTWHFYTFFYQSFLLILTWESVRWIHNSLNKVLPFKKHVLKRIAAQLSFSLGLSFAFSIVAIFFVRRYAPFKINDILQLMLIALHVMYILIINLSYIGTYFFDEWKESLVFTAKLEQEKANVQYDNLKNQLNPHFLFNSITSLQALIHENQDLASEFLLQLAKVYRYVLQNRENEQVSILTESRFIENYLMLLKTRFGEIFDYKIEISDAALEKKIVPVTLQVLVENAIKHNSMTIEKPLLVRIYDEVDYLVVENSFQVKSLVETSNKIGLSNLQNLYGYLSKNPIIIEETAQLFRIKIPLL